MAESRHHSIGEVLSMLKDEHTDVTISKIRFFESQGLIDPERTPSGYRKFYDEDIDRLRWILVQQRDNFLPLKVIKRRMEDEGFDPKAIVAAAPDAPLREPTLFTRADDDPGGAADALIAQTADTDPAPAAEAEPAPKKTATKAPAAPAQKKAATKAPAAAPEPKAAVPTVVPEPVPSPVPDPEPAMAPEPVVAAAPEPEPDPEPGPVAAEVPPAPPVADGDPLDTPEATISLTTLELAETAGVDLGLISELRRLGMIETIGSGDIDAFNHEALVVTKAAGTFMARGVEPRHLRMFKVAADRQSGVLEQLVGPKLRKGGESRKLARAELNELVQLGEAIQRSILRRSFGSQLD